MKTTHSAMDGIEKITLCGDNCFACPRYTAKSEEELKAVAKLRDGRYQQQLDSPADRVWENIISADR